MVTDLQTPTRKHRPRSYWQSVYVGDAGAMAAVKSWFSPLCEGMTPYKVEVLCDIETDREKKIRAFMTDASGKQFKFERTKGRQFSISVKPLHVGASADTK